MYSLIQSFLKPEGLLWVAVRSREYSCHNPAKQGTLEYCHNPQRLLSTVTVQFRQFE